MSDLRIGSLFSGYGGLEMAVRAVMGGDVAWVSDNDPGACKILAHRYPDAPNLGDITKVKWTPDCDVCGRPTTLSREGVGDYRCDHCQMLWPLSYGLDQMVGGVEPVDIITGGFPCQDVSHAGKRAGLGSGTRTGLWSHMALAIETIRPRFVVAENVRGLLSARADSDMEPCPWCMGDGEGEPPLRALGAVLGDLADIGYDTRWVGLRAADVGAPHGRFRVFIVATDTRSEAQRLGTGLRASEPGRLGGRRPDDGDSPGATSDPAGERGGSLGSSHGQPQRADRASGNSQRATSDADRERREGERRLDVEQRDADRCGRAHVAWGPYEPAVRRWERTLGRVAPAPTEVGPKGGARLSPRFVEWLMGLPAGHVCDVPGLTRNQMLKALGNGVVPQQAEAALRWLLDAQEAAA